MKMDDQQRAPLISVIVPVYQVEKYISRCLDSLLKQTLKEIEIICVDDCGTDDSMRIVKEYSVQDGRVKILEHKINRGLAAARNTGMDVAKAPYIMFCDSDDYYDVRMCEKLYSSIESLPEADMAMCDFAFVYEYNISTPEPLIAHRLHGFRRTNQYTLRNARSYVPSRIHRRDFLEKYHIRFPEGLTFEDWYFYHVTMLHARGTVFVPEKLYYYRRHKKSITHTKEKWGVDYLPISIKLWNYCKEHNFLNRYSEYMVGVCSALMEFGLFYSRSDEKKKVSWKMVRDFINTHDFTKKDLPMALSDALSKGLGCGVIKKHVFGDFIKSREDLWKKETRVCGMRAVTTSYNFDGIIKNTPLRKTSKRYNSDDFTPFNIDNTVLLNELRGLEAFTYIPSPGNMSSMLIGAVTERFFDEHKISYLTYQKWSVADHIVFGGGDFWSSEHRSVWEEYLPILRQALKVVILPSIFRNCPDFIECLDSRFTVFCSDEESYQYLQTAQTGAKIILDHDMALRAEVKIINSPTPAIKNPHYCYTAFRKIVKLRSRDIAYFMSEQAPRTDIDIINIAQVDSATNKDDCIFHAKFMLCLVGYFNVIVTDRPHVAIAAALMGKEVYMVGRDCQYLYERSLKDCSHVHYSEEMPQGIENQNIQNANRELFNQLCDHYHRLQTYRSEAYDAFMSKY